MAMKEYLSAKDSYEKMKADLVKLRQAYARRDKSAGNRILSLEKDLEVKKAEMLRLKNRVVKTRTKIKSLT